jgi:hypothetical protein
LYAKLAVIAIRETVCYWMTAKKGTACSSFPGMAEKELYAEILQQNGMG